MPFLTQGKTNWKYILIVLILVLIVGGGLLGYLKYFNVKKSEQIVKKLEPILLEEIVHKIIDEITPSNFNKEAARYYVEDLNEDGKKEVIIIVPCTPIEEGMPVMKEGFVGIVTITDEKGNYKKIGELKTEEVFGKVLSPEDKLETPEITKFEDVDNDGQKEMFLTGIHSGAASSGFIHGILNLDFSTQKLDWLKLKNEEGKVLNTFEEYVSDGFSSSWEIEDVNKNGKKELVERTTLDFENTDPKKLEAEISRTIQEDKSFKVSKVIKHEIRTSDFFYHRWTLCAVRAYEWDGSFFSYSEELSKLALESKCKE